MVVPHRHGNIAARRPDGPVGSRTGPWPPEAILESLDDGLIVSGLDGRVTFHNPAAGRLLGVTGRLLVGACLKEVMLGLGIRPMPAVNETAVQVTTVAGRRRRLRLRTFCVRAGDGAVVGVGHLVEDITGPARIVLRHRDLELDTATMSVTLRGRRLDLTRTELELLRLFMENPGRTLRHARVLRHVWGPKYGDEAHYVRVYVNRLRQKIEADPAHPTYFVTERGIGYRLAG